MLYGGTLSPNPFKNLSMKIQTNTEVYAIIKHQYQSQLTI